MADKLANLAKDINSAFVAVESARVEVGRLLLKAQAELLAQKRKNGRIGRVTFKSWCAKNVRRSWGDITKCMALARSQNPAETLAKHRKAAKDSMAKSRANKAAASDARRDSNVGVNEAVTAAKPAASSDSEVRDDEGFTAEDHRIWDELDAAAKAAGDDEGPWRASAPGVAPFYALTREAVYRKLYDAYLKSNPGESNPDKPDYKDFAACGRFFNKPWGGDWFMYDLSQFELDEREEAYKALIAEPEKPEIIQPNRPPDAAEPPEQKTTKTKWKASSIVGDGIDPVVFEGDSESMVYEDACEHMWDLWFGGDDTPDLPELKRFMALMAEFYPDIVWKFEHINPSAAEQVRAVVAKVQAATKREAEASAAIPELQKSNG